MSTATTNNTVIQASLSDQIFDYIAANPNLTTNVITVHKRFIDFGYSDDDINVALSSLLEEGTLELTDVGFLTIGTV